MKSYFSNRFFSGNRANLRQVFTGTAPIIITANGLLQRGGDSTYAFSQDANFWYLTGIDEPDVTLVIDNDEEYLIVPARSGVRETFDGAVAAKELGRRSGVTAVYDDKVGWEKLESRLRRVKHAATVPPAPSYVEQYGFFANPARSSLTLRLKTIKPSLEFLDIGQDLARLRMIKQPAELRAIQAAIDITAETLKDVTKLNMLSMYTHEYQLEAEIRAGFRKRGASGDAFEPIVAGGRNACTLHNVANNDEIKRGALILTDVGAEVEHYTADITRVFKSTKPSRRQKEVHAAVAEVQQFALEKLKPGVLPKDYEQAVEHFMGEKLRALKLIKDITHENVRKYYPHSTSHFLGLNIHDVGDYTTPLRPGVVMTVEPGIYIPEENIGVRIEDDILITAKGNEVLSGSLVSDL